ncbi:hypothetical protein G7070_00845 [Propioniciclava coleopterorum]|uniref:Helix-hairpin-helix DNA-binding motif class 1 domain-containing protein n=1 Tax=Propioniciclava coleopterorum TaxID=2714937 RepID=A0A6G7Y378_9ACTN|nr:helix-hairpin-helix domain-containing protein [Propioniciclava coleopterorum]QIK71098.1 hypothetical protein G7070_00845 [Propioniciclava coleopterorum]
MSMLRPHRDPALGDVVRARLAALLDDLDGPVPADAAKPAARGTDEPAQFWAKPDEAAHLWAEADEPARLWEEGSWPEADPADADDGPRRLAAPARGGSRSRSPNAEVERGRRLPARKPPASDAPSTPFKTDRLAPGGRNSDPSPGPGRAARLASFTRRHLTVVAGLGLVGLVATLWGISQARAVPVEAPVATPIASASAPGPTSSPSPAPTLRVHVVGAVAHPGVVSLPEGARVEDAIAAAGGLLPEAKPGDLNLAEVIADGAQVAVGDAGRPGGEVRAGTGGGGAAPGTPGAKLDLNRATAEQLEALPGVGPVTAAGIMAWRAEHGRFTRVEELQEVDGIGAKTLEKLAPLVRV